MPRHARPLSGERKQMGIIRPERMVPVKKRPLCLIWAGLIILIVILKAAGAPVFGEPRMPEEMKKLLARGMTADVTGAVMSCAEKDKTYQYVLRDVKLTARGHTVSCDRLQLTVMREDSPPSAEGLPSEGPAPAGSVLHARGTVKEPEEIRNPGQFDSRRYLESRGIFLSMFANTAEIRERRSSLAAVLSGFRADVEIMLFDSMGREEASVLAAMLLGDRQQLSEETKLDYRMSGVMHVLSISGMHISLIGDMLYGLFMEFSANPVAAAVPSVAVLTLYVILTGESVSSVRALIMFAVMILSRVLKKSYDSLSALALAGILILCRRPGMLFDSGFQMSFAAVLGAAVFYPVILRILPEKLWKKGSRRKKFLEALVKSASGWAAVNLAVFPLSAFYYYEVPLLWSLPVNLLLVPCMTLVMADGLLGSLLLCLCAPAGRVVLLPADLILRLFSALTGTARNSLAGTVICGAPHLWQIALCYGIVFTALTQMRRRLEKHGGAPPERREIAAVLFALAVAFEVLFAAGQYALPAAPSSDADALQSLAVPGIGHDGFSLTMLDVGQGDGLVLRCGSRVFLVDGGSLDVRRVGEYRLLPYLKHEGIREIEGVFLSHQDEDHTGGILEIFEAIAGRETTLQVHNLFLPRWMRGTDDGRKFSAAAESAGAETHYLSRGDALSAGEMHIRVVHPLRSGGKEDGNQGSMALLVSYRGFDALLTGDLEAEGELETIPYLCDVDLLKAGHHGSRYGTSEELLRKTSPEVCLISAPRHSLYGHPHRETLERITASGAGTYCTKDCGAITVRVRDGKMYLKRFCS